MKTLLLLAALSSVAALSGCISVERETPDSVTMERTTVIER